MLGEVFNKIYMTSLSGYAKDMDMNHIAVKKSRDNFNFFMMMEKLAPQ